MSVLRIYADFNGLVDGHVTLGTTAVVIDTFGSLRDLANAGTALKEGMPLVTFDASDEYEDLEGHGVARFDPNNNWWVVEFDEKGVRYVPAGDRTPVTNFNCVSCANDLTKKIASDGLNLGDKCPSCGTEIHSPIAPPSSRAAT